MVVEEIVASTSSGASFTSSIARTQVQPEQFFEEEPLPPPPPGQPQMNMEQMTVMQLQLLQALAQNQVNQPAPDPAPIFPPPSRPGEFMRTKPPTFAGSVDPLEADDWLKDVEKKLILAQCNDQERVLYTAHQLKGTAGTC